MESVKMTAKIVIWTLLLGMASYARAAVIGKRNLPDGTYQITLHCIYVDETLEDMVDEQPLKLSSNTVIVSYCSTPNQSYADVFRAFNIDVSAVSYLILYMSNAHPKPLKAQHFMELTLQRLDIYSDKLIHPEDQFLEPLTELKVLATRTVHLPPLPVSTRVENMSLVGGLSTERFGECRNLKKLEIDRLDTSDLKAGWLANCTKLETLSLISLTAVAMERALVGMNTLKKLTVQDSKLLNMPQLFNDTVNLRVLDISHNELRGLYRNTFESLSLLEELYITNNLLTTTSDMLNDTFISLRGLRVLSLYYNPIIDFCSETSELRHLPLERLNLSATRLSKLCFGEPEWDTLSYLDLRGNFIKRLEFDKLPSPRDHPLIVDLRDNDITEVPANEKLYNSITEQFRQVHNMTILIDITLDCDCAYGWFVRILRSLPRLSVQGVKCLNGEHFYSVLTHRIECELYDCGTVCTCRQQWNISSTHMDCRQRFIEPDSRSIITFDNFTDAMLLKDIKVIDFRSNGLSRMNMHLVDSLFLVPDRYIFLGGNVFICDCENLPLIAALQSHEEQVVDYDNITCVGNGQAVRDVVLDSLCTKSSTLIVVMIVICATIIFVALFIYFRYKRQIKIFLYTRGLCLSCLHEEDIDADRQFDAFVSFCHEDDEFVNDHLLPGLEGYKLCIHYRDWIAGEWIAAQIARSIEQSRRVIVVLSNNFLQSKWGMLEFRLAFASSLQEGRARVIVVMLDAVADDPRLDAEFRGYLATNTYVTWGEKWFWSKIRYALPQRKSEQFESVGSRIELRSNDTRF